MRAIATKQPTNDSAKQKKNGDKGRSRSVSPLSTGMPLLQRKCACGGGCPRCQDEQGIQTKLKISEPGDKYEQEADRIADEVMRMPEPSVQRQVELEEKEEELVQRKKNSESITSLKEEQEESEAPPIVHEVLNSPGQSLDPDTLAFMESRFGHDFSQVRLHTDAKAAESAQSVNARAYTVGQDVVFGERRYAPGKREGRRLIAHELAHTVQQSRTATPVPARFAIIGEPTSSLEREAHSVADTIIGRKTSSVTMLRTSRSNLLQRVPAAPSAGSKFDRSKVAISEIADRVIFIMGLPFILPQQVTVTFSDPTINHLCWEFYDPSDNMLPGSFCTDPRSSAATTMPFVITAKNYPEAAQGRYLLRCVGLKDGTPIAYADKSFFIWTSAPTEKQDLKSLNAIKASPGSKSFGEVGAAYARAMMLEHQAAISSTGTGKYMGNRSTAPTPAGVAKEDCTTYVLEVLKQTFTAKGQVAAWKAIYDEAKKTSAGAFKGTELLKALESKAGWKAVFWAPDPRNPQDKDPEHPAVYRDEVIAKGTYKGIPVDSAKSIVDYRRTSATKPESMTRLDQLRRVPFAVIAARGGTHMVLLLNGVVYEVHWDKPATDPNVIEATPLEKWAWLSGVVVMPPEDFQVAFNP